jgi:hypothetical protein
MQALFEITVVRSFVVTIEAPSREKACRLAEFYLGYKDESTARDRAKPRFAIQDIDLRTNDALEAKRLNNSANAE